MTQFWAREDTHPISDCSKTKSGLRAEIWRDNPPELVRRRVKGHESIVFRCRSRSTLWALLVPYVDLTCHERSVATY